MCATRVSDWEKILSPQVLVVDDTRQIRLLITAMLRSCGYRVLQANDGLAARVILMTAHPALVISDLEMPVYSGWELLTHCHLHYPKLPVMLVSGGALGQRPEIESWAASALPKPFGLTQFRAEVQRLVPLAA